MLSHLMELIRLKELLRKAQTRRIYIVSHM